MGFVTANMTGHALWQTFVNKQDPDREPDVPVQPADTLVSARTTSQNYVKSNKIST